MGSPTPKVATVLALAVGFAVLIGFGSWLYWLGEGRPGTPAEFRDQVAETGLVVEWTTNGPRGGDGIVVTDCGPNPVSIQLFEDNLMLVRDEQLVDLTPTVVESVQACEDP